MLNITKVIEPCLHMVSILYCSLFLPIYLNKEYKTPVIQRRRKSRITIKLKLFMNLLEIYMNLNIFDI
jgi:hypothetical protein